VIAALQRRVELCTVPTPVRSLDRVRRNLWVKDEGAIHPAYGGNKVRKLEFLLHGAEERVVTLGAAGSHHVLATAVHASRLGHRVEAMAFPRPETAHARDVLRAATARATIHAAADFEAAMPAFESLSRNATSFPAGGSNATGTLGWVRAGLELAEQVERADLPAPRRVFCPLGTAGTVLGAAIGMRLGGLASQVVAVRVVPAEWLTLEKIRELGDEVIARLGLRDVAATDLDIAFDDGRLGGGYGVPTLEGVAAIERGCAAGLDLEPTYTGKTFGAVLAADPDAGPDLYWQTHSTVTLAPLLAEAPPLTRELEAMLEPIDAAHATSAEATTSPER
jgi:1-aminocyclopropane-1-carboxylate deaminase/D-cysteine desulfhydrase-like pyridoxal-dependent ACC family enzyme